MYSVCVCVFKGKKKHISENAGGLYSIVVPQYWNTWTLILTKS